MQILAHWLLGHGWGMGKPSPTTEHCHNQEQLCAAPSLLCTHRLFTSSNLGTQIHLSNLFPLILFSICYCSYLKKIALIKRMCFALKEDFIRFPGYSISWLFHGKVSNINYFYLDLIRKQSPIKLTDDKKVFARKILWMIIDYIDC